MTDYADEQRSPQQVAELLAIISSEDAAFRDLTRSVEKLYEIHAAKEVLATLTTDEIRLGMQHRHARDARPENSG